MPIEIRYRLAYDGKLLSEVLAVFLRAARDWHYRQAKAAGHKDVRCGSVTFAQRFGSALNLNPHFHTLVLDGVYAQAEGVPTFLPAPMELLEKLSALVPPPRVNMVRYHGVLGPNAKNRDKIVPSGKDIDIDSTSDDENPAPRGYRLSWAVLPARVFQLDALRCECGGRMRIVATVTDPASVRRYLEGVGLPADVADRDRLRLLTISGPPDRGEVAIHVRPRDNFTYFRDTFLVSSNLVQGDSGTKTSREWIEKATTRALGLAQKQLPILHRRSIPPDCVTPPRIGVASPSSSCLARRASRRRKSGNLFLREPLGGLIGCSKKFRKC